MSFGNQGKLSFVFFHEDELDNCNIHVFSILHDSDYLMTLSKNLKTETTFKSECEKIQYAKFECFSFRIEEYFYWSWRCQNTSSLVL